VNKVFDNLKEYAVAAEAVMYRLEPAHFLCGYGWIVRTPSAARAILLDLPHA
jgi:hypothetical protein